VGAHAISNRRSAIDNRRSGVAPNWQAAMSNNGKRTQKPQPSNWTDDDGPKTTPSSRIGQWQSATAAATATTTTAVIAAATRRQRRGQRQRRASSAFVCNINVVKTWRAFFRQLSSGAPSSLIAAAAAAAVVAACVAVDVAVVAIVIVEFISKVCGWHWQHSITIIQNCCRLLFIFIWFLHTQYLAFILFVLFLFFWYKKVVQKCLMLLIWNKIRGFVYDMKQMFKYKQIN